MTSYWSNGFRQPPFRWQEPWPSERMGWQSIWQPLSRDDRKNFELIGKRRGRATVTQAMAAAM